MGLPEYAYYRESKRVTSNPLIALRDRIALLHYRFTVTFGLYVMTPGERLVCYLFCLAFLSASLWIWHRLFSYFLCIAGQFATPYLAHLEASGWNLNKVIIAAPGQTIYKPLRAAQTSLHAVAGGELSTTIALARNASLAASP